MMPPFKDKFVPKLLPSATWITTGLLTTLAANAAVAAATAASATTAATAITQPAAFSSGIDNQPPAAWRFVGLPGRYARPPTVFDVTEIDGHKVLRVRTSKSYGNLVHAPGGNVNQITWRWRLDDALSQASLKNKKTEDMALKVCLSFDMPVANIPLAERATFRLANYFSPEPLPSATLCYVWANAEAVGTAQASPYTGRVHYMVLDSGDSPLKTWREHTRDVKTDFLKAFGAEIQVVPALTAIIVGADSDNTQGTSLGYIDNIQTMP
jgi:hypothetical protein